MFKKLSVLVSACVLLAACASSQPKIIQASSGSKDVVLAIGMATQIELPDDMRVASAVVGNKNLVSVEIGGDIVTLAANGEEGETNLILRARDDDGDVEVFQYRIIVQNQ